VGGNPFTARAHSKLAHAKKDVAPSGLVEVGARFSWSMRSGRLRRQTAPVPPAVAFITVAGVAGGNRFAHREAGNRLLPVGLSSPFCARSNSSPLGLATR